ncbi:MAG: helix-hairpin-helix domain-containing protein, partial [Planctomycetes bacterium]|nr:helix-hairpin-helix domain-containing protein [Planctomycetota bacterium]
DFTVTIHCPQRGDKLALVRLANLNAEHAMKDREEKQAKTGEVLANLQVLLELENTPRLMECYDISHHQGGEMVGSGVCFSDGAPDKKRYRRYRIMTVEGNDDFACMEEVLRRRLTRAGKEGEFPDLIVIDGGAQQLARVQKVFDELNVVGVDLIGLAKSRDKSGPASKQRYSSHAPQQITDERVFLPGKDEPVTLNQKSPELFMLMRLRDEAHRFAIRYHRELSRKSALTSGLDAVPGIGPKRKKALIKHFGSPAMVKEASVDDLMKVEGVTEKLARAIHEHFRAQTNSPAAEGL